MTSSSNIEAAAAKWVAREDGESWSADRSQELQRWLDADTAHRVAYLRLRHAWDCADRLSVLGAGAVRPPRSSRSGLGWAPQLLRAGPLRGAIAAGAAVIVIAATLLFGLAPHFAAKPYSTQLGGRETIALTDGTKVLLNTDTRVRADIGSKFRVVHLDRGEAFFDVRHDAAHPFIVIAGGRRITDLGTRFSVRLDGRTVKVVVEEGEVRIDPINVIPGVDPKAAPAVVRRGGMAVAEARLVLVVSRSDAQLARDLSWREGLLSFNQTTLAAAAEEFNRYNEKKLVVQGAAAAGVRIDGAFRSDNVVSFARLLREGFGLKVDDDGDEIVVSE